MFVIKSNSKFINVRKYFGYSDFSVTERPRTYVNESAAKEDLYTLIQSIFNSIESQTNNHGRDAVQLQQKERELVKHQYKLAQLQYQPYIEVYQTVLRIQRKIAQLEQDINILEHDAKLRNCYLDRFDSVLFSDLRVVSI